MRSAGAVAPVLVLLAACRGADPPRPPAIPTGTGAPSAGAVSEQEGVPRVLRSQRAEEGGIVVRPAGTPVRGDPRDAAKKVARCCDALERALEAAKSVDERGPILLVLLHCADVRKEADPRDGLRVIRLLL